MRDFPSDFAIAVHPGDILQEMLQERQITQSELARHLRRGISAPMAVLLAKAFGTSAGLWVNLQKNWELSQVDPRLARAIRPLKISA